jgi:hypothetical protein
MDLNADVEQSKLLIDVLLGGLLKNERKIDPHIFLSNSKTNFDGLFFEALEML